MFWLARQITGWGWFVMAASMILFWALIIIAVVLLVRAWGRTTGHARSPAGPRPEQLLAERFARGEIDEEGYQRRLAMLRGSDPSTQP